MILSFPVDEKLKAEADAAKSQEEAAIKEEQEKESRAKFFQDEEEVGQSIVFSDSKNWHCAMV